MSIFPPCLLGHAWRKAPGYSPGVRHCPRCGTVELPSLLPPRATNRPRLDGMLAALAFGLGLSIAAQIVFALWEKQP